MYAVPVSLKFARVRPGKLNCCELACCESRAHQESTRKSPNYWRQKSLSFVMLFELVGCSSVCLPRCGVGGQRIARELASLSGCERERVRSQSSQPAAGSCAARDRTAPPTSSALLAAPHATTRDKAHARVRLHTVDRRRGPQAREKKEEERGRCCSPCGGVCKPVHCASPRARRRRCRPTTRDRAAAR